MVTLLKLAFAVALILWLIESGQLDFLQMRKFIDEKELLLATIAYFVLGPIALGTLRWKTLLQGAGYRIAWKRAIQLQMTGFFFNTVMPGAVGGDIIKIAYVIRDNRDRPKTQAMMTVLLDRIVGLSGLFLVGWTMIMINYQQIVVLPKLWPIITMMSLITLGFVFFFTAALYHYQGQDPFSRLFRLRIPGFSLIEKLYNALRIYRYARPAILKSIGFSLAIQVGSLMLFYFICLKILPAAPHFGPIAAIFPVGMLTTAIPITPGGLGVGHVAFDSLFNMIRLDQGATVFNLFVLSQLFLNLLGVIPYLSLRRHKQELNEATFIEKTSAMTVL
jgi:hypothetical protein